MKGFLKLIAFIVIALLAVSCKTQQPQVVEKIVTNTEYVDRWRVDSVYIDNIKYIDRSSDTIKVIETKTEYRYKVITDSVEVIKIDSIPYTVEVIKEGNVLTPHQKTLMRIGLFAVIALLIWAVWRLSKILHW
jgi:repressor of nif and glnA expression